MTFVLALQVASCAASQVAPIQVELGQPLVVLYEGIGYLTYPVFAGYDNGAVLVKTDDGYAFVVGDAAASNKEYADIQTKFMELDSNVVLGGALDGSHLLAGVSAKETKKWSWVVVDGMDTDSSAQEIARLPAPLQRMIDLYRNAKRRGGSSWSPSEFIFHAFPRGRAKQAQTSCVWPQQLPRRPSGTSQIRSTIGRDEAARLKRELARFACLELEADGEWWGINLAPALPGVKLPVIVDPAQGLR